MQPIDDCNHGISSPKLGHFFGKGQGRPSAFSPLVTRLAWSAFFTNMERKKYHQEGFRVQGGQRAIEVFNLNFTFNFTFKANGAGRAFLRKRKKS